MIWPLLGIAVLLALITDQIWTRRNPPSPRLYQPGPYLGWTLTPGVRRRLHLVQNGQLIWEYEIQVNTQGFNDREWTTKKADTKRVLIMGDSIVESRQVPRPVNFVARAEALLNDRQPRSYELFNVGVAGWSADSALNYFQHRGHGLRPDMVVLALFVGNDLIEGDYETFRYLFAYSWDCRRYDKPAFGMKNGRLERRNYPAWRNVPARLFSVACYTHSRSFRWLYQRLNRVMEKRYNGSNLLRARGISYNLYMDQTKGNEFFYAQTEAQVDALAEECRQIGARLGVLLVPNFSLFYPIPETDIHSRACEEYQRDLKHYHEMQQRLCVKHPVLSLIEPLHASSQVITFKPADSHFNRAGHELVAGLLAEFIRKLD